MLGDFIGRGLFMILGYAYPAFECFKTVERNKVDILELRFWCQYWIIIAVLSVCERFGDFFISWLPLYGEMKLAFIIYLWYPKTKGTSYVYDTILRPLVTKHETDIDKHLTELRLRAWDLGIYYYQNCTDLGQSAFFNVIQYVANQSTKLKGGSIQNNDNNQGRRGSSPPPSTGSGFWPLRQRKPKPETPSDSPRHQNRRWPPPAVEHTAPSAPPMPATFPTLFKDKAHPLMSKVVQVELEEAQTEYVHVEEHEVGYSGPIKEKSKHHSTRLNFLRSKT